MSLTDQGAPETEEILSAEGRGDTFARVMERSISRRGLLKGSAAAGALIVAARGWDTTGQPPRR